jgi:hypothetical protein
MLVGGDGALGGDGQGFKPVAAQSCGPAHGADQLVKLNADLGALMTDHQDLDLLRLFASQGLVPKQQLDAVCTQPLGGKLADLGILAYKQAVCHLHLGHG